MRRLIFTRHAEAEGFAHNKRDFDRKLTRKGRETAYSLGVWLFESPVNIDRIFSSPAIRTLETANIIAEVSGKAVDALHPVLYNANPKAYEELIRELDDEINTVLFVGHNPGISEVVRSMSIVDFGVMPPGGTAVLEFPAETWLEVAPNSGIPISRT